MSVSTLHLSLVCMTKWGYNGVLCDTSVSCQDATPGLCCEESVLVICLSRLHLPIAPRFLFHILLFSCSFRCFALWYREFSTSSCQIIFCGCLKLNQFIPLFTSFEWGSIFDMTLTFILTITLLMSIFCNECIHFQSDQSPVILLNCLSYYALSSLPPLCRVHLMEEQLREVELKSLERLTSEQRKHREQMVRRILPDLLILWIWSTHLWGTLPSCPLTQLHKQEWCQLSPWNSRMLNTANYVLLFLKPY